jgi:hypothetical protein
VSMPTTITELADDTAFERFVLDRTFPLMPSSGGAASVVDLGKSGSISVAVTPQPAVARVSVSLSDSSGSPEGQLSVDTVRPLIFGAAWKVFDQLVELALEQAGVSHDRGNDYTIKLKSQSAAGRMSRPPWKFGGGPGADQAAASSLLGVTVAIVASSAARSAGRCR